MSAGRRGDRSSLQKTEITCKTCGVTESFYSDLSVQRFKARHAGHDIVGSGGSPPPKAVEMKAPPMASEEPIVEKDWGTRLSRVVVDVVVFPALRDSVFRVRGFKDNLEEGFVATSRFENGEMVKKMLESGEFVDFQAGGTRYTWGPGVIEFEGDSREMLGMPRESASEAGPEKAEVAAPEPMVETDDSIAKSNEVLFGEPETKVDALEAPDSVFPVIAPSPLAEEPPTPQADMSAPEPVVELEKPELEVPGAPEEPVRGEAPSPPPPEPVIKVEEKVKEKAPEMVKVELAQPEVEEAETLLVSKSWYIQGGDKNRKEAARVSKVLKDFRWRVEPLYTIGLILDDILSIETSKAQISRGLIRSVEKAGYRLTAITADQGKLIAWFKRTPTEPKKTFEAQTLEQPSADDDDAEPEPDLSA